MKIFILLTLLIQLNFLTNAQYQVNAVKNIEHTEGAKIKFHVFTQYPTGFPPADSIRINIKPEDVGIVGAYKARDLWAKNDIGEFSYETVLFVRKHGAKLLKISETQKKTAP